MELNQNTKIDDLLKDYPFLTEFLVNRSPKFKLLESAIMRKTVGKVATLSQVASIGGVSLPELLAGIAAEIRGKTGQEVIVRSEEVAPSGAVRDTAARHEILKDIIRDLHAGVEMAVLKKRFQELIKDIDASEIARMEQKLMEEGMPETEIKRLCDVHVEVFKESLEKKEAPVTPPGHPVHTFMKENRASEEIMASIDSILQRLGDSPDKDLFRQHRKELADLIGRLGEIDFHYLRKENQLFPVLETHGITGPTEVMWAIHDDIRQTLKYARDQVGQTQVPLVYGTIRFLLQTIRDMIYKEEHILYPLAMDSVTEADWARVKAGEEEIGYAWIRPDAGWAPAVVAPAVAEMPAAPPEALALSTGMLTPEQVNLLLTHLPVDISFVNAEDEVIYYSQTKERIFPRSPGVIGRKVQKCHPPKSFHMVQKILDEFRAGRKDVADFWIQKKGHFLHIRYFAVRDAAGTYRGTLEVSQDVTGIRKLEGEQRLLDWEE